MVNRNAAFEEKGAATGHNKPSDKDRMEVIKKMLDIAKRRRALKQEEKDLLNAAKDRGHLKTPIRNAAKTLDMSEEAYQAMNEVERETKYNIKLFADKGGQWSWLTPAEGESEAA